MKVVRKKRQWVVEGAGDGWVCDKAFARKWLAELALAVFQEGGDIREYWKRAVAARPGTNCPWSPHEEINRLYAQIQELRPDDYEMLVFAERNRDIITKVLVTSQSCRVS